MKRVFTLLLLSLSFAVFAQNTTKVIILDVSNKTGRVNYSTKTALKSDLAKAVSNTPGFESTINDQVDAMLFEAGFQQHPNLSKDQAKQIFYLSGATYALLSEASIDEQELLTVSTKLLDLEGYSIAATESANMSNTPNDIMHGCEALAMKMLLKINQNGQSASYSEGLLKEEEDDYKRSQEFVMQQQSQQPQQSQYQQQNQTQYNQPQYNYSGKMKRKGKYLVLNDRKLTYDDIIKIFSYEDAMTYQGGRSNIETGNSMCGSFFAVLASLTAYNTINILLGNESNAIINGIGGVALNFEFAGWIIYKAIGKGRLNYLVDTYNNGQTNKVSYNFSPTILQVEVPNANGQSLGYGATFTISF